MKLTKEQELSIEAFQKIEFLLMQLNDELNTCQPFGLVIKPVI